MSVRPGSSYQDFVVQMRPFRVYTFCEHEPGRRPRYSAYTLWANPVWPGCKTYDVEAANGTEAKKIAIKLRKTYEEATNAKPSA